MEKRILGQQCQDAADVRGFSGPHNGMLPPVATPLQARESSSIALERIFDQINSSSSDVRSVMDLLDSVRKKTNSMVEEQKGMGVRRGDTHRGGPGDKDQEISLADAPAHELRDSDMLLWHESGRNDRSSLSQKNTDFLSIRKLAQITTPAWRSSRDGCSVPISDIRRSPQSSGDMDAAKLSTVSMSKESPIDLQLPASCVSGQRAICSRAFLTSFSDRRKQCSRTPAQILTQVNEFPGQLACAVDCSRSNDMLNQSTAQLTIFYAGKVNVYDNVTPEMAKAIMIVARSCDSSSQSFMNNEPTLIRSNCPVGGSKPVSEISTTLSGAGNTSTEVAVEYNSLTKFSSTKSVVAPILTYGTTATTSAAVLSSTSVSMNPGRLQADLPVARKASLARFLEKRKDRSHEKAPNEAHNPISVNEGVALLSQRPKSPKKVCIRRTSSPVMDPCS